jgi:hypothetical protein
MAYYQDEKMEVECVVQQRTDEKFPKNSARGILQYIKDKSDMIECWVISTLNDREVYDVYQFAKQIHSFLGTMKLPETTFSPTTSYFVSIIAPTFYDATSFDQLKLKSTIQELKAIKDDFDAKAQRLDQSQPRIWTDEWVRRVHNFLTNRLYVEAVNKKVREAFDEINDIIAIPANNRSPSQKFEIMEHCKLMEDSLKGCQIDENGFALHFTRYTPYVVKLTIPSVNDFKDLKSSLGEFTRGIKNVVEITSAVEEAINNLEHGRHSSHCEEEWNKAFSTPMLNDKKKELETAQTKEQKKIIENEIEDIELFLLQKKFSIFTEKIVSCSTVVHCIQTICDNNVRELLLTVEQRFNDGSFAVADGIHLILGKVVAPFSTWLENHKGPNGTLRAMFIFTLMESIKTMKGIDFNNTKHSTDTMKTIGANVAHNLVFSILPKLWTK